MECVGVNISLKATADVDDKSPSDTSPVYGLWQMTAVVNVES